MFGRENLPAISITLNNQDSFYETFIITHCIHERAASGRPVFSSLQKFRDHFQNFEPKLNKFSILVKLKNVIRMQKQRTAQNTFCMGNYTSNMTLDQVLKEQL